MTITLKDVVLGTPAGKKAVEEALKKSCEDQVKLLEKARRVKMKPKDLDCTFTFKLADEGVKRINELNKEQLKEAKRLIDKALEDYEEAKVGYIIDPMEKNCVSSDDAWYDESDIEMAKELGIWFETKEEAEKAVEKLKAWTRLKDKGARFKGWFWDRNYGTCIVIGNSECDYIDDGDDQNKKDLDLLFGGEE